MVFQEKPDHKKSKQNGGGGGGKDVFAKMGGGTTLRSGNRPSISGKAVFPTSARSAWARNRGRG